MQDGEDIYPWTWSSDEMIRLRQNADTLTFTLQEHNIVDTDYVQSSMRDCLSS
jgi:hypothetical protein